MATRDANGWTPNDYQALVSMATRQNAPADWFAASMLAESDLIPSAKNSLGYRGLIQIGTENLRGFGLSDQQIQNFTNLTPAQQMPYVERFLRPWKPAAGWLNRAQIQQAIYLPASIKERGSDPQTIIAAKNDAVGKYRQAYNNPTNKAAFDPQNKGYIQVQDLENRLQLLINREQNKWNTALTGIEAAGGAESEFSNISFNPSSTTISTKTANSIFVTAIAGLALGASAYYIYQQQNMAPRRRYA